MSSPVPRSTIVLRTAIKKELDYACRAGHMKHFVRFSAGHGVPIYYALAVASRESRMGLYLEENPSLKWQGDDGASWGIMQINIKVPGHARALTLRGAYSAWDHQGIIDYGVYHLGDLRRSTGSWVRAFMAYNAGPDCKSDACTTGGNYGSNVATRSSVIKQELQSRGVRFGAYGEITKGDACRTSDSAGSSLPVPANHPADVVLPERDLDLGPRLSTFSSPPLWIGLLALAGLATYHFRNS